MTSRALWGRVSYRWLLLLGALLFGGCAAGGGDSNGGSGNSTGNGGSTGLGGGGNGGSTSGNGGSGNTGGTTGAGGATGQGGTGDGGVVVRDAAPTCANPDRTIVPIDATGFATRGCNDFGMQGAWYCYADGAAGATTSCMTGKTPYLAASTGMCLSGATSTAAGAYGAGIGFSLNDSGGAASVKSAYNAQMANVIGFEITVTGTTDVALRMQFTTAAASSDPAPFVALPGAGTYQVMLADAVVPGGWANANAGSRVNPASIFDVQLAVPASSKAANYNYCITKLKPILAGTTPMPPGSCATGANYGSQVCGAQDLLGAVGNYAIQNNINTGAPGTQCVQAMVGGATCGGFSATFTGFGNNGSLSPSSYPSIIYGWQNGSFYGGYRTPQQISAITSAMTNWQVTTPSAGKWNAAYDIWLAPSGTPTPKTAAGGLELMIWVNYGSPGNAPQPIGTMMGTVTVAGETWNVWRGSTGNGTATWMYLAYQRPTGSNSANFNLKDFFTNAMAQGVGLQNTWVLLGVQAGFEVWQQGGGSAATTSFSVNVN